MFQLTAAHPVLPIPSYVRVTNLDNGKDIVVRINDRGPFHPGRIIDLSYAGATMLGFVGQGTARVKVEAIVPEEQTAPAQVAAAPAIVENTAEPVTANEYLQIGAFSNLESARSLVARLSGMTPMQVFIQSDAAAGLHKVRVGPVKDETQAREFVNYLESSHLGTPFRVRI
jgi:rare lipoprotein A